MKDFDSLADEPWRIQVDDYDLNEPTICYPDPDRRGCFVGPLGMVHVGATVKDDEGEEMLDLEGADGRNLAAVACLPQIARLFRWIDTEYAKLGISENEQYNQFVDALKDKVCWIRACIDDRPETMTIGLHGFEPHPETGVDTDSGKQ